MDFKLLVSTESVLSFCRKATGMFTVKRVTLRIISSNGIKKISISAKTKTKNTLFI